MVRVELAPKTALQSLLMGIGVGCKLSLKHFTYTLCVFPGQAVKGIEDGFIILGRDGIRALEFIEESHSVNHQAIVISAGTHYTIASVGGPNGIRTSRLLCCHIGVSLKRVKLGIQSSAY